MKTGARNPLIISILGDVKATKSVICCVLAFLEAVEEDFENGKSASPIRVVQDKVVKENGVASQGKLAAQHVARFGLPTDNIAGDKSGVLPF